MKLALWCDMELAEGLITYLPQDLHIVCIIDENLSVQGQMLGQVPVISFDGQGRNLGRCMLRLLSKIGGAYEYFGIVDDGICQTGKKI
ncbi:hypothetical protein SELR_24500 [Selenomonas ruminantium subsp. lactilytica TAM6421]|uniref:Uncharacterized protein n=1 Tax=Selenomonas ruminantium subsp. lactilytica (strain NBRC 103574 / TAM6421) TaxID=927704 RepID=I0GTS1_SELRL|nr:hypothetical protein [Selenomonas ruminantium]BAL84158.1 hypothetical protein SELR_24500 [Selenomonas ruminantium subsp. lactilytica TAM6421]